MLRRSMALLGRSSLPAALIWRAKQLMEKKVEVRMMEEQSTERHLGRLRDGRPDSLQASSRHLDILRDLKRINAHIVSVAHPIMDESGFRDAS
jgi:phosphate:Na+ symporter